jgi:hypothetical protein
LDIAPSEPVFSVQDTLTYTPPKSPRSYVLSPLSYRERNAMRRQIRAEGGDPPDQAVMFGVLRQVLEELAPANLHEALAAVDAAEAAPDDKAAQARLAVLERVARQEPAYAELLEARLRYNEMSPFITLQFALREWSGPGLPPLVRGRDSRVPAELLDAIPAAELEALATRAQVLIWLGPDAAGNSEAPSPSPESPAPTQEG